MRKKLFKTVCLVGLLSSVLVGGCSTFGETHYFASTDTHTGEVVNVFRLNISGGADLSNARYLAGYYDERAVDIFFNEIDSTAYNTTSTNGDSLKGATQFFNIGCTDADNKTTCQEKYAKKLSMSPLGADPNGNNKAFVLILSTRADAISETIGAIAEDSTMKQTLFRMANKDMFKQKAELDATKTVIASEREAVLAELNALFAGPLVANNANENDYLSVLAALAGGLSSNAPVKFSNFSEAENWFNAFQVGSGT